MNCNSRRRKRNRIQAVRFCAGFSSRKREENPKDSAEAIEGGNELRRKGGPGILAEMLLDRLDGKDAVIDSIRTPGEVEALREREDFILIEVQAGMEARWQRAQSRGRTGDISDKETFFANEEIEAVAKDESGQALNATAAMADLILVNDGSVEDLYSDLDEILRRLS